MASGGGARTGSVAATCDNLSAEYAAMGRDRKAASRRREACMLFTMAERHLTEEQDEEALGVAHEASELFKHLQDSAGFADSSRIVFHVLCYQGKYNEAEALATKARAQLERMRGADDTAEAKMLLSLAEIRGQMTGENNRAAAFNSATKAMHMFRTESNNKMEGLACLAVANLHLRGKGDGPCKESAEQALKAANTARLLFKALEDRRSEGIALHAIAAAHVQAEATGEEMAAGAWLAAAQEAADIFQGLRLRNLWAWEQVCIAQWTLLHNPRKALHLAEEAMDQAREMGSIQEAVALGLVVKCHLETKDSSTAWQKKSVSDALSVAKSGVKRFKARGDSFGEAQALMAQTLVYLHTEEHEMALKTAEQARGIHEDLNDRSNETLMLQVMVQLHLKLEDTSKAARTIWKAEKLSKGLSEGFLDKFLALEGTFESHRRNQDFTSAIHVAGQIESLAQGTDEPKKVAVAKLMKCNACLNNHDYHEAIMLAREAQAIFNEVNAVAEEAESLRIIAEVYVAKSDHEPGVRAAERARKLLRDAGDFEGEAAAAFLVAQIKLLQLTQHHSTLPDPKTNDDFAMACEQALDDAEEASALAEKSGNQKLLASVLCTIAQIQTVSLNLESAFAAVDEAMQIFKEADDKVNVAAVMCIQADVHLVSGNSNKALAVAEKARTMFEEQGDDRGRVIAWGIIDHIQGPQEEEQWNVEEWQQFQQQQWQAQQAAIQQQQGPEDLAQEHEQGVVRQRAPRELTGEKMQLSNLSQDVVQRRLRDIVLATTDLDDEDDFEYDKPLMQLGITSKTAVVLRNTLSEELPGIQMPFTLVFDYPSVNMISDLIMESGQKGRRR